MTRKAFKKNYQDSDRFDRKQKKHSPGKEKSGKNKFSIYDEYSDEEDYDYSADDESYTDEEE